MPKLEFLWDAQMVELSYLQAAKAFCFDVQVARREIAELERRLEEAKRALAEKQAGFSKALSERPDLKALIDKRIGDLMDEALIGLKADPTAEARPAQIAVGEVSVPIVATAMDDVTNTVGLQDSTDGERQSHTRPHPSSIESCDFDNPADGRNSHVQVVPPEIEPPLDVAFGDFHRDVRKFLREDRLDGREE